MNPASSPDTAFADGDEIALDTIVRFHDVQRLAELRRCVFSLAGQNYRPLRVIVALQRFTPVQIDRTREAVEPVLGARGAPAVEFVNWEQPGPPDARSDLLNLGLAAARGRFVAFLDFDDVLYPEAYELLVRQLHLTGAAICFASVRVMRVDLHEHFHYTREVVPPFPGSTLLDLFKMNFCPIHSYVIDRRQVSADVLRFESSLSWEEDYEMLLRLCARFKSDFSLVGTSIGDYYFKTDGSNTVPANGAMSASRAAEYERVRADMEARRRKIELSLPVQQALGLPKPRPEVTIADALAMR